MKRNNNICFLTLLVSVLMLVLGCQRKTDLENEVKKSENKTEKRIFDNAELLSDRQEEELLIQILKLEENVGSQIGIVLIDTLNGEKIERFSLRTAENMNLGRSKFNDGILIAFSVKDRKIRIEVGYGLEKIIKDEIAAEIIREDIAPKFKQKGFYEGLLQAIVKIKERIEANQELVGQKP